MQDAYVGDISDFGKITLLQLLLKETNLRLGVLWHFVEKTNQDKVTQSGHRLSKDGKHRTYLESGDPHQVMDVNREPYKAFQKNGYAEPDDHRVVDLHQFLLNSRFFLDNCYKCNRQGWLQKAHNQIGSSDIIFFDPDNGIASRNRNASYKHVPLREVNTFWERNKSLVIYHHLAPIKTHLQQNKEMEERLRTELEGPKQIHTFHMRRGTSRIYYLVIHPNHEDRLPLSKIENIYRQLRPLQYPLAEWKRERCASKPEELTF